MIENKRNFKKKMTSILPSSFNQGIFADEKIQKFMLIIQSCFTECFNEMISFAKSKSNNDKPRYFSNYKSGLETIKRWDNRLQSEEFNQAVKKCQEIRKLYIYTGLYYVKLTHKDKIHMKTHLCLPPLQDFLYLFYLTVIDEDLIKNFKFENASGLEKDNMFQNCLRKCLIQSTNDVKFTEMVKPKIETPIVAPPKSETTKSEKRDPRETKFPLEVAEKKPVYHGCDDDDNKSEVAQFLQPIPFKSPALSSVSGPMIPKSEKPKFDELLDKSEKPQVEPEKGKSDYWNHVEKGVVVHPEDSLSNVNLKSFKTKYKLLEKEAIEDFGPALPLTKSNLSKNSIAKVQTFKEVENNFKKSESIVSKTDSKISKLKNQSFEPVKIPELPKEEKKKEKVSSLGLEKPPKGSQIETLKKNIPSPPATVILLSEKDSKEEKLKKEEEKLKKEETKKEEIKKEEKEETKKEEPKEKVVQLFDEELDKDETQKK